MDDVIFVLVSECILTISKVVPVASQLEDVLTFRSCYRKHEEHIYNKLLTHPPAHSLRSAQPSFIVNISANFS